MDTRRSYYLASGQGDFAEPAADFSPTGLTDIPFVMAANPKSVCRLAAALCSVV